MSLISNFHRALIVNLLSTPSNFVVFVFLGDSPSSEFYVPTFRNNMSVLPSYVEQTDKKNYSRLYAILSGLGVFTFCTCCILNCLACIVASFKLSCV